MHKIATIFDYTKDKPKPLQAVVQDHTGGFKHFIFFLPGTGIKLNKIYENISEFVKIIKTQTILLNDFKAHLQGFDLDLSYEYNVYDITIDKKFDFNLNAEDGCKFLQKVISAYREPQKYQRIFADAQIAYQYLENKKILWNSQIVVPKYDFAFSGRSKTLLHNIQGSTESDDIRHIDGYEYLVHFDWVSADMRVASFMSGDPDMEESFINSDPYTKSSQELGISRDECKTMFLASTYSLSVDSPIIQTYPTYKQWMMDKIDEMNKSGVLYSILGRSFKINGEDRSGKSVFSGMIQGSVAHAMQSCLYKIFKSRYIFNLLTETHDAITMSCKKDDLKGMIESVSTIMLRPLRYVVDNDVSFPVKVYIGKRWKKWEFYKEYRCSERKREDSISEKEDNLF